ncbi:PIN domain-containing protein [Candidatus Amesbacteria bacterium]|nr:PIN domain-containing protein [Candidatus Amesbacteria bacterium]
MTSIFIDSSVFVALYRKKDLDHKSAVKILSRITRDGLTPIITDYILDETYTGILTRGNYKMAMDFDKRITNSVWKIELITAERFAKAREIFCRYNKDKIWSFTDCTSWVVMKELKIKKIFTFDKNFVEMGFELLDSL